MSFEILFLLLPSISFLPLILIENKSLSRITSLLFFIFYYAFNLHWLYETNYLYQVSLLIIILSLFHIPTIYLFSKNRIIAGLTFWVILEYFHVNFGFPITVLGHHLGECNFLFGMLKYTGILGFSLLALCANGIVINLLAKNVNVKSYIIFFLVIGSMLCLLFPKETFLHIKEINVLALNTKLKCPQPKYSMSTDEMLRLYEDKLDSVRNKRIELVLFPENAFDNYGFLTDIKSNRINKQLLKNTPHSDFILGGISKFNAPRIQNGFKFNRHAQSIVGHYNYNSIINLNRDGTTQYRHKYKLVPFNEYVPFPFNRIINSTIVGYKYFKKPYYNPNVFNVSNYRVGSAICYESIFGNFVSEFVRNGANVLTFHYNEGWYSSPVGSKKMILHAKIRAAETAKYVVGSSNMGYSFIVNSSGSLEQIKRGDVLGPVLINNYLTFYSKHGDYIGIIGLLYFIVLIWKEKRSA